MRLSMMTELSCLACTMDVSLVHFLKAECNSLRKEEIVRPH